MTNRGLDLLDGLLGVLGRRHSRFLLEWDVGAGWDDAVVWMARMDPRKQTCRRTGPKYISGVLLGCGKSQRLSGSRKADL